MPTSYTAGIIDGDITTFEQFATQCTRQFGATIHMKDDSLDVPYEPRTPSEYFSNRLQSEREELERMKLISDQELIQELELKHKEDLKYYEEKLGRSQVNCEKLNFILESTKSWIPPTEDHQGLKVFMIEQLEITIKGEGNSSYYLDQLINSQRKIDEGIEPKAYREKRLIEIEKNIFRHEDDFQKDFERCKKANLWMEKFFYSIGKSIKWEKIN